MIYHKSLSEGGWQKLSLMEQLGNIGSEISRAKNWQGKNELYFQNAVSRALELFDLTLEDPRWKGRRGEIARAREVCCDAFFGGKEYNSSLADLISYFDAFARVARANTQ
ncbi:hypothetical protein A3A21_00660 [Candidatus Jorgensenbacteria bacterium RIFCSPLOWO2_01_FULL_45_25b]|uniref:Uncharacterized protein n=1 Tax=Candidatus Jorgensenbacteria bacterium RIFCSPLOWO2_01_FULL_45_25b TaxID=1798471 RepID=A0A1F6BTA8_9BACT|nr:MAG: hypothetical protein A3A21_00660 [Candidatus Jorgensenbacteria bacterium RIFCSPLOWO2_01_FULL_45_25b]